MLPKSEAGIGAQSFQLGSRRHPLPQQRPEFSASKYKTSGFIDPSIGISQHPAKRSHPAAGFAMADHQQRVTIAGGPAHEPVTPNGKLHGLGVEKPLSDLWAIAEAYRPIQVGPVQSPEQGDSERRDPGAPVRAHRGHSRVLLRACPRASKT